MWRLLLVDDHALFREGLEGLLAYQDDFKVVGQAEDAQGALALAQEVRPDVVLMDVDLPGDDGISATRRIKAAVPEATVVMLTAYDDSDRLLQALKAGAQGYLLKNIRSTERSTSYAALPRVKRPSRGESRLECWKSSGAGRTQRAPSLTQR